MSGLCLTTAMLVMALPFDSFTLAWTHSIEKIRWEEDYRLVDRQLRLTEARVRGFGAGMEPADGAVFRNGVWHYRPGANMVDVLRLARSDYTADYLLCQGDMCQPLIKFAGIPAQAPIVEIHPCRESPRATPY